MTSPKENCERSQINTLTFKKREKLVNYRLPSMEYVQKHHLTSLYLKLLYMKVIFSLQLIYVLCKFDLPNHLMEFQPKFFRDP